MKAAVLNQIGDSKLELRDDVTTTDVGDGEIRIRVRATGVCHSDLSAMDGTLPALAPGIIGHEGAGEVVEVGARVDRLAVGDHVVLTFVPPCGRAMRRSTSIASASAPARGRSVRWSAPRPAPRRCTR